MNSNQCNIEDLPEILKELKTKALANLGSRQNRKTPFNKLKRNLEGLFIQMKNVSIFISTQAGDFTENNLTYNFPQLIVKLQLESCKTRTKFRGVLTKLKGKAVKLLSLINSKYRAIHGIISMDDFEKGIFPWDVNSEDDSENESSTCKFFIFFCTSGTQCYLIVLGKQCHLVRSMNSLMLGCYCKEPRRRSRSAKWR